MRFVGRVVLINGSLGSGGAERQLVNTAVGLHRATQSGRPLAGVDICGPVNVVCRSLHSRVGADFYASALQTAGLQVFQYSDFPEFGGRPRLSAARELIGALDFLPTPMRDGVARLSDVLRYLDPDVVHIWQDGSILAAGLAAVLAGVPRIVLGVRTLPPSDRFERNKPEYEATYRCLVALPGVSIVANSQVAASRYEAWLGMPAGSVEVIANGLAVPDAAGDAASLARWDAFAVPDGAFVVGSVMRFDDNKRPLLWLDVAAKILRRAPDARFVLVGEGPLLQRAQRRAEELGIADKVLFTGRSQHVGFWLSKMGVFLLLSRHEGLPNVLIEAQMRGVPVVTTPAGGAGETMRQGETGTLLPSVSDVDADEIVQAVLAWRQEPVTRASTGEKIAEWAVDCFSVESMLASTAAVYLGPEARPFAEAHASGW